VIGGLVSTLLAGVALVLPGTAFGGPSFLLGVPDPCPGCNTVRFDGGGLAEGASVTNQFVAENVEFLGSTQYDDGSLGQSSAPGFSGGSLVSGIPGLIDTTTIPPYTITTTGAIVIIFDQPVTFAAFAFADTGVPVGSTPRTLSAYLGSQLVASTQVALPAASFLAVAETFPAAAAADAAYLAAIAKFDADYTALVSQTATVTADQANIDATAQAVAKAEAVVLIDYSNYVSCNNYICDAYWLVLLADDAIALSDAENQLNDAAAQLQTDQARLAALQQQYMDDQTVLAETDNARTAADALYQQALADDPGPGFIGFEGTYFNILVLSGGIPTAIDTLEMVPESSTLAVLGGAVVALLCLRRIRRAVP
jgi:hypothetical protein